jgi:hypothetical protein
VDILSFIRERSGDYDCPVCRDPLVDCDLKLLRQDGNTFTVQVACARCRVTFVVVLQFRGDVAGLGSAAAPDVDAADAEVEAAPPISADELLDVHETLRDWSAPIVELVGRPARGSRIV